ncbi:MAG TPA: glycoside hydrolase family 15 protein [Actinopolymorphaceae bacterium]
MTAGGGRTLRVGIAGLALLAAACVPVSGPAPGPAGLFADGLAVANTTGGVVVVPPRSGESFVPGTRVLTADRSAAGAAADGAADRRWLVHGTTPGSSSLLPMNQQALLDLRSLTAPNGAVVAGSTAAWRYVWPRDASFVAAAYSATGHRADALRVLTYLASIAPADGRWQARYLPDGSGRAPDDRGVQLDGAGWVLWAIGRYVADGRTEPATVSDHLGRLWPMVSASADAIAGSLASDGLPPTSSDYWERREHTVTLGTVTPDLAGLQAAVELAMSTGRTADARRWAAAAATLKAGMDREFGTDGWHRTRGGELDSAVTFTMAPFLGPVASAVPNVVPRDTGLLDRAFAATRNSNGGVRPGANWHRDGVSWTPETALFALAFAANGEPARAGQLLTWLSAHRTGLGSLPEKVNPDGSPAAVAPLAWTCALVLLASVELGSSRR